METIDLESWTDFSKTIEQIRFDYGRHTKDSLDGQYQANIGNRILFRGLRDSSWGIKTTLERTLERTTADSFSIASYLLLADSVVNEIESHTDRQWNLPSYSQLRDEIERTQDSLRPHIPDTYYPYLVYLRHHGFPSPLLDWTRSPWIAAYFALEEQDSAEDQDSAKRCSVFAFIETPNGDKMVSEGSPILKTLGPYVTTHTRHFAQKSTYSIATQWDRTAKRHVFCSHESVQPSRDGEEQDVLIKITIPRSDRIIALRQMEDFNINHFTLFGSTDSLVRALAMRAFEFAQFEYSVSKRTEQETPRAI